MCGIVGAVGNKDIVNDLLTCLYNLEYRGYDSAGIAVQLDNSVEIRKVVGGIKSLENLIKNEPISGRCGIGHTRWATHGAPSVRNSHPISNPTVTIVHNGIIDNYTALKTELIALGFEFKTDTDTEVIAHLIELYAKKGYDPFDAVTEAAARMDGLYAFVALFHAHENKIFGYKHGAPLIVGIGNDVMYLGSDAIALSAFTKKIVYLEDNECALLDNISYKICDEHGNEKNKEVREAVAGSGVSIGKFPHFMLKEIMEQPQVLARILTKYISDSSYKITFPNVDIDYTSITSVKIVACGSSYYSASVASYWIEDLIPVNVSVDIASEFCYRSQNICPNCLYIFISQSGETADTLASLKRVSASGAKTLSIVNVEESSIARLAQYNILTHAGAEISVASTKACTAQLMVLALFALQMASSRGDITDSELKSKILQLQQVSDLVYEVLVNEKKMDDIASSIANHDRVLFIGRGDTYPVALEGALKLREISYITAMGIAAGELKHGTIALVDEGTPTIVLAPYNNLFSKTVGSAQSIHARGGPIELLSSDAGVEQLSSMARNFFILPHSDFFSTPIIYSVAVQLIAYKVAVLKGLNVDKPRNLAKSVTVE